MKITDEQEDLLSSFFCERISRSDISKKCASRITSKRGAQLVEYLIKKGVSEDSENNTAFYIIRNTNDLPLAFFSLKCGLLFSPSQIDLVSKQVNNIQQIIDFLRNGQDDNNPDNLQLRKRLEDLAVKSNKSLDEIVAGFASYLNSQKKEALKYKNHYLGDQKTEADKPIFRVEKTYSGIELVHFCTNDHAKDYWKTLQINHPLGEVLFWKFIVPKLQKVQDYVGCQYAYLFAADSTEDRTLINYYNVCLKFQKLQGIGTSKPFYDFCCEFLAQEINQLSQFRTEYFENFNLDEDVEIV